ncbi:MAG: PAS domain S-box protein [Syntrophobacteraceae bacterium]
MISRPYRFGHIFPLVIIPFITLAAMSAFQLLKHILWPHISIWASHVDTVIFISAVAAVGGFFACRYLEAHSLLSYIVESSDDAIIGITLDGIVLSWNKGAEKIYGYPAGEVVGKPISILLPSDRPEDLSNILGSIRRGERVDHYETARIRKDGKKVHISLIVSPIFDAAGIIIGASSIARDITERKEGEEQLKQTNAYLENVLENSPDAIGIVDQHGKFIKWNKMAAELYGYSFEDLRGKSSFDLYPDREEMETMLRDLRRQGSVKKREILRKRKDGSVATFEVSIGLLKDSEGRVIGSVSMGRDLSEIKKALIELKAALEEVNKYRDHLEELVKERTTELANANELLTREIDERKLIEAELHRAQDELELRVKERTTALEKANEELQQIPSKLIAVLEEERKRLSYELHDSVGQTLAAVKLWVEMVLRLRDQSLGSAAFDRLEQFVPILQRSIEETRNIYMGLCPPTLDNLGLLATLEWLRRERMKLFPQRHIELEAGVAEEQIPENLKVNIFRIAQEALNNIDKHSKAEWVDISLSNGAHGTELVISDDGVGMNLDQILQTRAIGSLGLTSMRERAELTGGSFLIESTPGEGTTIRASWPIEVEDQLQQDGITQ